MTIYDVELSFDVSVNVTPLPLYSQLTQSFTHVRKIAVPFVTTSGGVNSWADYGAVSSYFSGLILPDTDNENSIIAGNAFNPEAVVDTTFTEFTTDDLVEDMYEPVSWGSAVAAARGLVNESISDLTFTSVEYIKFTAGFDITSGITKDDGFGYVGTRAVDEASTLDALEGDVPNPRKLAIIFYQNSAIAAEV